MYAMLYASGEILASKVSNRNKDAAPNSPNKGGLSQPTLISEVNNTAFMIAVYASSFTSR